MSIHNIYILCIYIHVYLLVCLCLCVGPDTSIDVYQPAMGRFLTCQRAPCFAERTPGQSQADSDIVWLTLCELLNGKQCLQWPRAAEVATRTDGGHTGNQRNYTLFCQHSFLTCTSLPAKNSQGWSTNHGKARYVQAPLQRNLPTGAAQTAHSESHLFWIINKCLTTRCWVNF